MEESLEEEDRISLLPDCLIIEILSCLDSTKDAIRTGVLSKRWQHLWTFVHTLIFHEYDISPRRRFPFSSFVSIVNVTISQCQSMKLNKLELYTSSHAGFESQLNNFFHYAINCNVQELYIEPSNNQFDLKDDIFFNNSCFTHLKLESCIFSPSGVISWNKLKSLCVSCMKLDENLIQNILSGSPLLETLELEYCYGFQRLDITSKSVKNLVFIGYDCLSNRSIKINAPNILSLTIFGDLHLSELLLLDVSSLLKANLNYSRKSMFTQRKIMIKGCAVFITKHDYREEREEQMLEGLLLNLHHVEELKVGVSCLKVLSRLEAKGLKLPSNVKRTS